jgi:hypothetical protein
MSLAKIEKALLRHFNTLTPKLPTAYEGASFVTPDTVYQRIQIVPRQPEDPVFGAGYYRERVELQVFVNAPSNKGKGEALARAELVRKHFKKPTTLQEEDVRIHVLTTPSINGAIVIGNRIIVAVLIDVVAEVTCG